MNDNHSDDALYYKRRWLAGGLRAAAKTSPVIVLSGARQVGKSTLLRFERPFNDWAYFTLDDFETAAVAATNPEALWSSARRVVIDEVQKAPNLLGAIKSAVDAGRGDINFVLSGSANLLLMQKVSESLAGRAVYFTLLPMTRGEENERRAPAWLTSAFSGRLPAAKRLNAGERPEPLILRGMMPPLISMPGRADQLRWWEGYVVTYLERDLRQLSQVDSLIDFRRVMEALALRSGQILNQTEVSRDTAVSQPTIYRYINLLEASVVLTRVPAFTRNRTKRLIKSPKPYFVDPGLAAFLCGHFDQESLSNSRELGALFETLVLLHLRAACQLMVPSARIYHWRTVTGNEVDFILEYGRKLIAVEVKMTSKPKFSDARSLRLFLDEHPEAAAAFLVHTGAEIVYLDKKIVAVPWQVIAGN
ncbi:MAG: ATP-binding protein [Actinomycetota bacterium]|nr:ATP-binding protein [Actinomycetota bacterium]